MNNRLMVLALPVWLLSGCQEGREHGQANKDPVAAVNLRPNNVFPAAEFTGSFRPEGGCIVIDVDGKPLTVIFPGPAKFTRRGSVPGVEYRNAFIPFGQKVTAMGGETPADPGLFELSEEAEERCPSSYFLLGPMATDGPGGKITLGRR